MRAGNGFGFRRIASNLDSRPGLCLAVGMARQCPDRHFFYFVRWSPVHKVVLDHRNGTVFIDWTDEERKARGLPVPWQPRMMQDEVRQAPVP